MNTLHVVVGLLFNERGEILIALRPPRVAQPGLWEFPGGKVEANETWENALIREYREEIGIEVLKSEFVFDVEANYEDRALILHVLRIHEFTGTPHGCENQEIRFVPVNALHQYTFPDANAGIIARL